MRRLFRTALPALGLLAATSTAAPAQFTVYALTGGSSSTQQLVRFNTANPNTVTTLGPTGANLYGLDFRPFNGILYASAGNSVYSVNTTSGFATRLFDIGGPVNIPNGFDFNPAADRLRITDGSGNNYRINVDGGATTVDAALNYAAGDANTGRIPNLTEVAYTNNDNDPATGTTIYGIDATSGTLAISSNPNGGVYTTVGSLGLGNSLAVNGFDIVTVGSLNTAFLSVFNAASSVSTLYTVNLLSGATTRVGDVGVFGGVRGFAVVPGVSAVPEPSTFALLAGGVSLLAVTARRPRARTPRA